MLSLVSVNQRYNCRAFIGDAIESAMLKGTEDLQLINVGVGSDDGVFGLFENCPGEFVAILDRGDIYASEKLAA